MADTALKCGGDAVVMILTGAQIALLRRAMAAYPVPEDHHQRAATHQRLRAKLDDAFAVARPWLVRQERGA